MVLHPVGPLPTSTYWRRRLVLLASLVLVVLLTRSCVGGGAEKRTGTHPTPSPTVGVTHSPTPRPTGTGAAGPVSCRDGALTLTTSTDAGQYKVGATPRITLTVTNVSAHSCRRDLGDGALTVLVYSGSDRIWSSDDCSTAKGVSLQTLSTGARLQTTTTWNGKRSAPGCGGSKAQARPGTYTVRAKIDTLESTTSVIRISS